MRGERAFHRHGDCTSGFYSGGGGGRGCDVQGKLHINRSLRKRPGVALGRIEVNWTLVTCAYSTAGLCAETISVIPSFLPVGHVPSLPFICSKVGTPSNLCFLSASQANTPGPSPSPSGYRPPFPLPIHVPANPSPSNSERNMPA